jgi:hypothetical protein
MAVSYWIGEDLVQVVENLCGSLRLSQLRLLGESRQLILFGFVPRVCQKAQGVEHRLREVPDFLEHLLREGVTHQQAFLPPLPLPLPSFLPSFANGFGFLLAMSGYLRSDGAGD